VYYLHGMSWTHDQVLAEVQSVILEHTDATGDLTESTELVGDLGIDSLGVMEVVAEIEDKFEMTIADAELRDVTTLGDVVKAIEGRLQADGKLATAAGGKSS
jgi:acyl carrier protein